MAKATRSFDNRLAIVRLVRRILSNAFFNSGCNIFCLLDFGGNRYSFEMKRQSVPRLALFSSLS
jgi:hypothetical protein